MSTHQFELRITCTYKDPDNTIDELNIEVLIEGEWEALKVDALSPGFLLFNYALFSCQHLYFRTNAAERHLMLTSSTGRLYGVANDIWEIETLRIDFIGHLKSGEPEQSAVDYIIERMGHCPVSCNMNNITDNETTVSFK